MRASRPRISILPGLPPDVYARRPVEQPPFPLADERMRLRAWGRHAVYHGVREFGLGPGDEVLAPAWHHGSEIEALARAGVGCRFYDSTDSLAPAEDELERLLGPEVKALYLIHYLGFPQDGERWRSWCDERKLLLIEDAAQAWLGSWGGKPLGSFGDMALFCLYKSFGVPEGAMLVSKEPPPEAPLDPRTGVVEIAKRHGVWLSARSGAMHALSRPFQSRGEYDAGDDFGLRDPDAMPWKSTRYLVERLANGGAPARRRANYRVLLESFNERVPAPFAELPDAAAPFALPVTSDDKPALIERMDAAGVKAVDLWSVPHPSLEVANFPRAAERRARTVLLPVHQELGPGDLELVAASAGRPRPAADWRLEPVEGFEEIRDEWSELARRSGSVFATPEWVETWWRRFGERRPLMLTACRRPDGGLAALIPLYLASTRPVRTVRFVGHGPSDQLGPICAPGDEPRAARALRRALDEAGERWGLFIGDQMNGDHGYGALLGGATLVRESNPLLRIEQADWDAYLKTRRPSLRKEARTKQKRLARDHELEFRLSEDPDRLEAELDRFFTLHYARWGADSEAFVDGREAFHREFAAIALERGWLRLWFMHVDGQPVAASYGFRFEGSESHYQSGREPAWEDQSVGFVLLVHTIRLAVEEGLREYRFLRGDQGYKMRFANADPGLETLAVARGPAGHAALLGARAADALPPELRAKLVRMAG